MEEAGAKVQGATERAATARVLLVQALMRVRSWEVEVPSVDSRAVEAVPREAVGAVPREAVGAVMTMRFGRRKSVGLLKLLEQKRGRRSPTQGVAVAAVLLAVTEAAKEGLERVVEAPP